MKILYYSPHPHVSSKSPSGSGRHIREMIKAFENEGHDVKTLLMGEESYLNPTRVINQKKSFSFKKFLSSILPNFIKTSIRDYQFLKKDQKAKITLDKLVDNWKPDMIYERGIYLMKSGVEVAGKHSVKHVWEVNAPFLEEKLYMQGKGFFKNKIFKIEKQNFENTDLSVFVSAALKDYYIKKYPFIEKKSIVTPNAIDLMNISVSKSEMVRSRFGLKDEEIVGFVGSIFPYHGVDILIKSFEIVKKNNKNTKLLIVGDGEILNDLKKLVKHLKLENDVLFTGALHHYEVFDIINIFDIAVMVKSNWYGSPVKIFEYGGMNKAIIAPKQPPVEEVMDNKVDGLVVNDTLEEISGAINYLLSNKKERERMALHFHAKVKEKFTWNLNAQKVIKKINQK